MLILGDNLAFSALQIKLPVALHPGSVSGWPQVHS